MSPSAENLTTISITFPSESSSTATITSYMSQIPVARAHVIDESQSSDGGLSPGVIVAIVILSIIGFLLILSLFLVFLYKCGRRKPAKATEMEQVTIQEESAQREYMEILSTIPKKKSVMSFTISDDRSSFPIHISPSRSLSQTQLPLLSSSSSINPNSIHKKPSKFSLVSFKSLAKDITSNSISSGLATIGRQISTTSKKSRSIVFPPSPKSTSREASIRYLARKISLGLDSPSRRESGILNPWELYHHTDGENDGESFRFIRDVQFNTALSEYSPQYTSASVSVDSNSGPEYSSHDDDKPIFLLPTSRPRKQKSHSVFTSTGFSSFFPHSDEENGNRNRNEGDMLSLPSPSTYAPSNSYVGTEGAFEVRISSDSDIQIKHSNNQLSFPIQEHQQNTSSAITMASTFSPTSPNLRYSSSFTGLGSFAFNGGNSSLNTGVSLRSSPHLQPRKGSFDAGLLKEKRRKPNTDKPFSPRLLQSPRETGFKYQAISDHTPQFPDEIVLRRGDDVLVLRVFPDSWCFGENRTRNSQGCFPLSCVNGNVRVVGELERKESLEV